MSTGAIIPPLGGPITEATVGQWLKPPGEAVAADEPSTRLEADETVGEQRPPERNSILGLAGMFKGEFPPMTIEEMNEVIADGWAGEIA